MAGILSIWRREDRLKTLAFLLAGWGCYLSFRAGGSPPDSSAGWRLVLMFAGYISALAGVVLALEIGNRRQRTWNPGTILGPNPGTPEPRNPGTAN